MKGKFTLKKIKQLPLSMFTESLAVRALTSFPVASWNPAN